MDTLTHIQVFPYTNPFPYHVYKLVSCTQSKERVCCTGHTRPYKKTCQGLPGPEYLRHQSVDDVDRVYRKNQRSIPLSVVVNLPNQTSQCSAKENRRMTDPVSAPGLLPPLQSRGTPESSFGLQTRVIPKNDVTTGKCMSLFLILHDITTNYFSLNTCLVFP